MSREIVFIGFGSNLGDRLDFCDRAMTLLSLLPATQVTAVSSLYETEPVNDAGNPGSGWFLNGVVQIETEIAPNNLLEVCREIEKALGRNQDRRDGPRTLDLDLLFYGTRIINEPALVIPHPRLYLRRFVLTPIVELAPDWCHPVLKRTVKDLLAHLADEAQVRRLAPAPNSRYGSRPTCKTSDAQASANNHV